MTNELELQQTRELISDFNMLDESIRDKLSDAINALAFLYRLTDFKNKDVDNPADAAQPA